MTIVDHPATGRRDRKKQRTRAALIAAALRLVAERGFEHVTVEEISEAADVSSRTFFNYFSTKEEALIGDPAADAARVLAGLTAVSPEVPALAAVRLALTDLIDEMQAHAALWFLRMEVVAQNPVLLPRLLASNAEAERAMTEAIAARTGLAVDHGYPALVTAVTGAGFRTAIIHWAKGGGSRPLADLVNEAFTMIAAGLPDPRPAR